MAQLSQSSAIGPRQRLADPQRLPSLAVVGTQVQVVIGAGQQALGTAVPRHDGQPMNVKRAQPASGGLPGLSAVAAAVQAADLHTGPNRLRLSWVGTQGSHTGVDDP